jgi:lipopolysaccharide transport system permease protein
VVLKVTPNAGVPSGNHYYAFYLFSAILPWHFLGHSINTSTGALRGSRQLITKVYFPRELIIISTVLSMLVTLLVELFVLQIALAIFGYPGYKYLPMVALLVIIQTIFATGLSLWVGASSVYNRDVPYLTSILMTIWFYITPILYSVDRLPEKGKILGISVPLRTLMMANPMAKLTVAYRDCFYHVRMPSLWGIGYVLVVAVLVFIGGYRYFIKKSPWFAEYI